LERTYRNFELKANNGIFMRPQFTDAEKPSSARASLRGKIFVHSHEVSGVDGDILKDLTGGNSISARRMRENETTFEPRFALVLFTMNDNPDPSKRFKLTKDDGLERRVRAIHFGRRTFEDHNNAEAAKAAGEAADEAIKEAERALAAAKRRLDEASKEGSTSSSKQDKATAQREVETKTTELHELRDDRRIPMYPEKFDELMRLAPRLMDQFITRHKSSCAAVDTPDSVWAATAKMWADAATINPLQEYMQSWYRRCGCAPKGPCTHTIAGSTVTDRMKTTTLQDGTTLYKTVKGRRRDEGNIWATIKTCRVGGELIELKDRNSAGLRNEIMRLVALE